MDSRNIALIVHPTLRQDKDRCPQVSKGDYQLVIARCQQLEKRVFPKSEAMDLSKELRKPNQFLYVVLQIPKSASKPDITRDPLLSYGVLAFNKVDAVARISKVCTDPRYRKQGAGELVVRGMLTSVGHPCETGSEEMQESLRLICPIIQTRVASVQLHVDTERQDAIRLYTRCGFVKKTEIQGYYAENRNAFLMSRSFIFLG
ncbi:hypothetical protein GGF40_001022 [Coemansia sp. RSA 1286]|nr:hypothetical protein GGF39_003004 [Coemansia sp. RSA 1721]KAJ2639253.1 hypothetical protein GGF40_001022 [Coemansia sp. RSA 1286]